MTITLTDGINVATAFKLPVIDPVNAFLDIFPSFIKLALNFAFLYSNLNPISLLKSKVKSALMSRSPDKSRFASISNPNPNIIGPAGVIIVVYCIYLNSSLVYFLLNENFLAKFTTVLLTIDPVIGIEKSILLRSNVADAVNVILLVDVNVTKPFSTSGSKSMTLLLDIVCILFFASI